MFFCAFLGEPGHERAWLETVSRHAAWLGLMSHVQSRPIRDGRVFSFGWLSVEPPDLSNIVRDTPQEIALVTLDPLVRWDGRFVPPRNFETSATQMRVSLESGQVDVAVPAVTTEQFLWAKDNRGWAFSNDMRVLLRWAGLRLDPAGIYCLFHYDLLQGALTLSRTVRQVPPAHILTLRPGDSDPSLKLTFEPLPQCESRRAASDRIRQAMDAVLDRAPRHSTLLFSGGVDSALMASRLAAMGRTDVTLLNFTAGPDDPDGQMGAQVARHLGLQFEQVRWNAAEMARVLPELAREYATPFNDTATVPSVLLVRRVSEASPRSPALLEGSFSGTLFSIIEECARWQRIYAVPEPVRRVASRMHRMGLWRYGTRPARLAASMQTSMTMPLVRAGYSYHNLAGVAYRLVGDAAGALESSLRAHFDEVARGIELPDSMAMLTMLRGPLSTAKFFDPARMRGIQPIHPFTEPGMLQTAFSMSWQERYPAGNPRGPLKDIIAENVPRAWMDRPKRGFRFPYDATFAHPLIQDFINDVALAPHNPVLALCRESVVREIVGRAAAGRVRGVAARRFLWAFLFVSAWIQQMQAETS